MSRRLVVQISIESAEDGDAAVWALCDDGTIWTRSTNPYLGEWTRVEGPPQEGDSE